MSDVRFERNVVELELAPFGSVAGDPRRCFTFSTVTKRKKTAREKGEINRKKTGSRPRNVGSMLHLGVASAPW